MKAGGEIRVRVLGVASGREKRKSAKSRTVDRNSVTCAELYELRDIRTRRGTN